MKICPNCRAQISDTATFCAVCGAQQVPPANQPTAPMPPMPAPPYMQPAKQPISVGGWIGRSLIPYIPIVGSIVYLVMLFIWMGDDSKEETFRNWAKARLIVTLISVAAAVLLVVLMLALGLSLASAVTDSPVYH